MAQVGTHVYWIMMAVAASVWGSGIVFLAAGLDSGDIYLWSVLVIAGGLGMAYQIPQRQPELRVVATALGLVPFAIFWLRWWLSLGK